jgi:G3E family GTPase
MSSANTLPVVLVSGFLGSGKTTLMRQLILDARSRNLRASVREANAELLAAIAGGCACCNGQNELQDALLEIASRPPDEQPDIILMEASGLADPILLLDVLTAAPLLPLVRATALLSVADAVRWNELAQSLGPLLRRQILLADWLLLNKTDLAPPAQVNEIAGRLQTLNPRARLLRTEQAQFDMTEFWQYALSPSTFNHTSDSVIESETSAAAAHAQAHTVVCPLPHPVERSGLETALQQLGPEVWRAKGFVRLRGADALQLVQYTGGAAGGRFQIGPFYLVHGAPEPPTSLVFLGANLDAEALLRSFRGGNLLAFW